jgi:hypothetical protein
MPLRQLPNAVSACASVNWPRELTWQRWCRSTPTGGRDRYAPDRLWSDYSLAR